MKQKTSSQKTFRIDGLTRLYFGISVGTCLWLTVITKRPSIGQAIMRMLKQEKVSLYIDIMLVWTTIYGNSLMDIVSSYKFHSGDSL